MSTPLRQQILDALVARFETIKTSNGYNTTITTVEVAARGWDELRTRSDLRPWLGIVPQREIYEDLPGYTQTTWSLDVIVHQTADAHTSAAILEANSGVVADVRKVLYANPQLGIDGVISSRIVSRDGSEGSPAAVQGAIASVLINIEVSFEEAI